MKRRIFILVAAIVIIAGTGFYMYSSRAQSPRETGAVPRLMAVPVARDSISRTISATGRLEPVNDRVLSFRASGTLAEILVEEGQYVDEGTELARLDPTSAYLELLRAQREYDRAVLESVESQIQEARLSLDLAQANYENTVLRAPFSGIVASIDAVPGSPVGTQTGILRLVSRDEFKVVVDVDETELRRVEVGQEVLLTVDSFPGLVYPGRVSKIGWIPSGTGGSVVYPVEITVGDSLRNAQGAFGAVQGGSPAALQGAFAAGQGGFAAGRVAGGSAPGAIPAQGATGAQQGGPGAAQDGAASAQAGEGAVQPSPVAARAGGAALPGRALQSAAQPALRPGLSVSIDIVIESAENVLTVPVAAVVESGGRSLVTRLRPDGLTEVVEVQTGLSDGLRVAILSGLSEGDQVLMNNYELYQTLPQAGNTGQRGGQQARFVTGGAVSVGVPAGGVVRFP